VVEPVAAPTTMMMMMTPAASAVEPALVATQGAVRT
jgi:hypothetical protein